MLQYKSFNPAEAGEGFSRRAKLLAILKHEIVSIQPKPEKGLVVMHEWKGINVIEKCFNPAEAGEGFSRI